MYRELIFTATYNESENIAEWVKSTYGQRPDSHVLIVDDNSPDGTGQIVRELQSAFPTLTLIERRGKLGLASAHRLAIRYALANEYEVLVTMDADLSHQPEQIAAVVSGLGQADFCIGTRYRGGSHRASRFRRFLSRGANWIAGIVLPTGLSEYTTSFRAFSRRAMLAIDGLKISDAGYAFFIECVNGLSLSGCTLTEVPIDFLDRTHGVSKIPKTQVLLSARTLTTLWVRRTIGTHKLDDRNSSTDAFRECVNCRRPFIAESARGYFCLQCGELAPSLFEKA